MAKPHIELPNKSSPWDDAEMIRVDGRPLAYHARKDMIHDTILVQFACGESATVGTLRAEGRKVLIPRALRLATAQR